MALFTSYCGLQGWSGKNDIYINSNYLHQLSLSRCSQINKIWNANLEGYRLFVVRKTKKHLQNQNIEFGPLTGYAKEDSRKLPEIPLEQLSLPFFVQFLRYLCHDKLKDCKINLRNMSMEEDTQRHWGIWPSKSVGAHM